MSPLDCQAQHIQLATRLPMLEHPVEGSRAISAPCEVALVVEKAQLLLVDVHTMVQDSTAKEVDLAVETKKFPTQALFEALHLDSQKMPSNLTFLVQSENKKNGAIYPP